MISTYAHDTVTVTVDVEEELQESRANEEKSKSALRLLHQELKEAYFTIAQQQKKLDILSKKIRSGRGVEAGEDEQGPLGGRIPDLAQPGNLFRKLIGEMSLLKAHPHLTLRPQPKSETLARIQSLWEKLPAWTKGTISMEDARFLDGLIMEVKPDTIHEVGVASGTSSALILSSMAMYADPKKVWLHSYDISEACYFDQNYAVGDATRTMVPHLLHNWELFTKATALDVPPNKYTKSLYFIDANHNHPWPALDLIAILPALKTGDVVALHDINLFTMSAGKFPAYGVEWLFNDWLGARLAPDVEVPNIGAFIIPEDKGVILASLLKTLSRPWPAQVTVKDSHLAACETLLQDYVRAHGLN